MGLREIIRQRLSEFGLQEKVEKATGNLFSDVAFPAFRPRLVEMEAGDISKLVLQWRGEFIADTPAVVKLLQDAGAGIPSNLTRSKLSYATTSEDNPVPLGAAVALWVGNSLVVQRRDQDAPVAPNQYWLPAGLYGGNVDLISHALTELNEETGIVVTGSDARPYLLFPALEGFTGVSEAVKRSHINEIINPWLLRERRFELGNEEDVLRIAELLRAEEGHRKAEIIFEDRNRAVIETATAGSIFPTSDRHNGFNCVFPFRLSLKAGEELIALVDTERMRGNGKPLNRATSALTMPEVDRLPLCEPLRAYIDTLSENALPVTPRRCQTMPNCKAQL